MYQLFLLVSQFWEVFLVDVMTVSLVMEELEWVQVAAKVCHNNNNI